MIWILRSKHWLVIEMTEYETTKKRHRTIKRVSRVLESRGYTTTRSRLRIAKDCSLFDRNCSEFCRYSILPWGLHKAASLMLGNSMASAVPRHLTELPLLLRCMLVRFGFTAAEWLLCLSIHLEPPAWFVNHRANKNSVDQRPTN